MAAGFFLYHLGLPVSERPVSRRIAREDDKHIFGWARHYTASEKRNHTARRTGSGSDLDHP